MRRLFDWAYARFGEVVGLVPALGLVIAAACAVFLLVASDGAVRKAEGTVTGLGFEETDHGSYPRASVQLSDGTTTIRLRRGQQCARGDVIDLRVRPLLWGRRSYSVGPQGCRKPLAYAPRPAWSDDAG